MPIISRLWAFHNTILLLLSLVLFFFIANMPAVHELMQKVGQFGYVGAVVAGIFFVSTFTVAPAAAVLFQLSTEFNPLYVALFAGAGSVLGDLLIFRFMRDQVFEELAPLVKTFTSSHLALIFKSPYFVWFAPVLGGLIIASPLPDEVGISLMGLSKINTWHFILLTYVLNVSGIFLVVFLSQAF